VYLGASRCICIQSSHKVTAKLHTAAPSPSKQVPTYSSAMTEFVEEDVRLNLLDVCIDDSTMTAEHVLLGSQWIPEISQWITLTSEHGASYKKLNCEDYFNDSVCYRQDIFDSCCKLDIPDNPPKENPPSTTNLFKFVLSREKSSTLNARLSQLAQSSLEPTSADNNIRVSNVGNGNVHTAEVPFTVFDSKQLPPSSPQWYSELYEEVLLPALLCIDPSFELLLSCGRVEATGWLNVNTDPHSFNALHDHGAATWSAVYFVESGDNRDRVGTECSEAEGSSEHGRPPPPSSLSLGNLLLRFQLEAFTQHHAYLAVPPTPGTLWIFPSYVPHCVMPRKLAACTDAAADRMTSQSPRISIACNVFCL
jgi:hypothetical protein